MRRFAVLVIASVLAPALVSAAVRPVINVATLPGVIDIDFGTLPGVIDEPALQPHPTPEVQPLPESVDANPCNVCFEYMTSLIDQLTVGGVDPALPELPTLEDVPEVVRPVPEGLPENIRPLPLPVAPEVEINPIPMPVPEAPGAGIRPLPLPVAPGAPEIRPLPLPILL